ncbi:hypothetical protein [Pseudomonas sp. YuFO8]|uniref:hypothetical protein n=1 Tax=Pseudomonas sp. YuFO8 TaxID=3095361 RepID=UPI002B24772A|nr:hypothetical protein [Pseudomonas sp. YuFO8]MEB2622147.1 hypothetical protein [Pseudomonas sp. YuFO8]
MRDLIANHSDIERDSSRYWLIFIPGLLGVLFSIRAFFPGWMSTDSLAQYVDAVTDRYVDWHPVLMAWWWGKLDAIYSGPALFLIQNIFLYWGGWCLFALAFRRHFGRFSYLIPLVGFWPGLLLPLGQIWKDVVFACSVFFAWAVIVNAFSQARKLVLFERLCVFFLGVLAFGVKTNGLVVLPFLFGFWLHAEGWVKNSWIKKILLSFFITLAAVAVCYMVIFQERIIKTSPFQYTQTYDLLGISVRSGENLLPTYIKERINFVDLKGLYTTEGNNQLFYMSSAGSMLTTDQDNLSELNSLWLSAIKAHPKLYFAHRLDVFLTLLRWNKKVASHVALPTMIENGYGFSFERNNISDWLYGQVARNSWVFYPWIYLCLLLVAMAVVFLIKRNRLVVFFIGGSGVTFLFSHFLIVPASDYRYLYYFYFCSLVVFCIAFLELMRVANSYKMQVGLQKFSLQCLLVCTAAFFGVSVFSFVDARKFDKKIDRFSKPAGGEYTSNQVFEVLFSKRGEIAFFKKDCSPADYSEPFFVHIYPEDGKNLSYQGYGFNNFDFSFVNHKISEPGFFSKYDGSCVAIVDLPAYKIKKISTGQVDLNLSPLWQFDVKFGGG